MEGEEQMSGQAMHQSETDTTVRPDGLEPKFKPRREKINSFLILAIGFFALIIAGATMWVNLSNPFADLIKEGQEQSKALAAKQQAELIALQTKDTDADGLTDYAEANNYGTSPYLKDSDSDGFDDQTEVTRGTDPNCPEGQNCFASTGGQSSTSSAVSNSQSSSLAGTAINITPDYIRQIMKANGATDAQLNTLSDEELMSEFKKYLNENPQVAASLASQGVNINFDSAVSTQSLATPNTGSLDLQALGISNVSDLKNLSGAQIRQLMISAGASASVLASVTDDQLKEMFLKQLEANTQNNSSQ